VFSLSSNKYIILKNLLVFWYFTGLLYFPVLLFGQNGVVEGVVRDGATGETLIGANILAAEGKGTVTDFDGRFTLSLPYGDYDLQVSYVGYNTITRTISVSAKSVFLEFEMTSVVIDEVIVVADVAHTRETPVAFSNVLPKKIEEELGGRDIPLILNSTPGVYATQMGGGEGDARITIRGFDQRNVAVMIDGLPVNDMENGWVYWSNWFGLDAVTRTIQVQRGLGASKLALPSVGGTMNIITRGLESGREINITRELSSEGRLRTSIGFTSGKLKGDWGITLAGSFKRGNGWVDNTYSEAWFYYAKIDKRFRRHILSVSALGAPQHHDQRAYMRPIATYDLGVARKLGIPVDYIDSLGVYPYRPVINNMGTHYNQHWGYLRRDRYNENAPEEILAERTNIYHKPQFTIRDFWTPTDKLSISNILYLSVGTGGGIRPVSSMDETDLIDNPADPHYGLIDWQSVYDANSKPVRTPFGLKYPILPEYSNSLYYSTNYMTNQHNDHFWYGLLSTASWRIDNRLEMSLGIDLRSYRGIHYTTITDLLGGDYAVDKTDARIDYFTNPKSAMKFVGDTISYYEEGLVKWGGLFFQAEYRINRLTAFINLTSALNGYKRINYFEDSESDWKRTPGFTFKSGANYNLTEHMNVFLNVGYLSKVKAFRYFFEGFTTIFTEDTENEKVQAVELGYNYHSPRFTANANIYYTKWINRPTYPIYSYYYPDPEDPEYRIRVYANIPGMNALHKGVEIDFIYKILSNLDAEGLFSLGDWKWDSYITGLQFLNSETNEKVDKVVDFDARGIHVGDAAQFQLGGSIRYEPTKGLYLNGRITHFGKYYSQFSPENTTDANGKVVDSWKMPPYQMVDFNAGYRFSFPDFEKIRLSIRLSILNVLNTKYIADATNNDPYSPLPFYDFDAKSATVFFGMGRRYTVTFGINF
jgi:iron complex outermembrane receptor protein